MATNKSRKPLRTVSKNELEREFETHLRFLEKSIRDYDAGDTDEFRRIAVALRVLLHRTKTCSPAVDHVGLDDTSYISYAQPLNPHNLLAEHSLALISIGSNGAVFSPVLDQGPLPPRMITLDEWKSEPVLRDFSREEFTRWELVTIVANQQGAHIDGELDEKYYRLTRENSVGWMSIGPNGSEEEMIDLEKAYMRHMGWEALASLKAKWLKKIGDRGCECGSGRKARYCCLKSERCAT